MSEAETTARLIANGGFPIFVALVLLYQVIMLHRESAAFARELKDEIAKMRAAVQAIADLLLKASKLKIRIRDATNRTRDGS